MRLDRAVRADLGTAAFGLYEEAVDGRSWRAMSSVDVRGHLVKALEADLVGPFDPAAPDEVLSLAPSRWYLTGFLAPAGGRDTKDPESDDELGAGPDEDDDDAGAQEPEAKQRSFFPASMGMSVLVPAGADRVVAIVSFAEYVNEDAKEHKVERQKWVWRRVPRPPIRMELALDAAALEEGVLVRDVPGIYLKGRLVPVEMQGVLPPGTRALSVFVVNERSVAEEATLRDTQFIFQVKLALELEAGFVPRPHRRENLDHFDEEVLDLQFRDRCEWAVGHNVSVVSPRDSARVTRLETTWLPCSEVRRVETVDAPGTETSMEALGAMRDGASLRAALLPLADKYEAWIKTQSETDVGSGHRAKTRDKLMQRAKAACGRIRSGVERLVSDPEAFEAFTLANRAMALAARQRSPSRYVDAVPKWRLFQLAFVLLNVDGLADPKHDDRSNVDLIFFPTGGGKTEAYLGVIAFALLLRRIRGRHRKDGGLGVAVLLRYTLRLLTLDQLGRAATLVCALELLRKELGSLGEVRFSVGLWVGRSATANTFAQVRETITKYKNDASRTAESGCPLTECPWCRRELGRDSFSLVPPRSPDEVVIGCLNPDCPFAARKEPGGLPVVYVDEQIYSELPSFLVATVDKFAMLPWRGETGMLFGRVNARVGRRFLGPLDKKEKGATAIPDGLRPPELVVQDELHLISGPLGTMVGLYETAIEHLSSYESDGQRIRPKILASTATVRRAREQIAALFGRKDMALFPPRGVNEGDTFFARINDKEPGRLYVGVAAPGRSMKAILLRTYVDLLSGAQKRFVAKDGANAAADPYMTLVGYFNSLRELGGMRRLVEDDVRTRCIGIEERVPVNRGTEGLWMSRREVQGIPHELTSREKTSAIASTKASLANPQVEKDHVDVLLASNMISVGVDIDRLGLMVVAGQPKTTSEYIQATSRVGRQHPGLVVTCFNVRRPRDRSHYERFAAYHESFYRFVEAQSLTPFSGPALDRGLAGTLVAMTRLAEAAATPPRAAEDIDTIRPIGERAVKELAARARRQPTAEKQGRDEVNARDVTKRAKNLLDAWERLVRSITGSTDDAAGGKIDYSPYDREKYATVHMLHGVLDDERTDRGKDYDKFRAPTSMRDVEASVHIWIARGRTLGGRT